MRARTTGMLHAGARAATRPTPVFVAILLALLGAIGPAAAADAVQVRILAIEAGEDGVLSREVDSFEAAIAAADPGITTSSTAVSVHTPTEAKLAAQRPVVESDGRVTVSWKKWSGSDGGLPVWAEITLRDGDGNAVGITGYAPASATSHTFDGLTAAVVDKLRPEVVIRNGLSPDLPQDGTSTLFRLQVKAVTSESVTLDWASQAVAEWASDQRDSAPLCQAYVEGSDHEPKPTECEFETKNRGSATLRLEGPPGATKTAVLAVTINDDKVITASVPVTIPVPTTGATSPCDRTAAPAPTQPDRSLLDAARVEQEAATNPSVQAVNDSDASVEGLVIKTCGVFKGQAALSDAGGPMDLSPLAFLAENTRDLGASGAETSFLREIGVAPVPSTTTSIGAPPTTNAPTTEAAVPPTETSSTVLGSESGSSSSALLIVLLIVVVGALTLLLVVLARRNRGPAMAGGLQVAPPSPTPSVAVPDLVPSGLLAAPVAVAAKSEPASVAAIAPERGPAENEPAAELTPPPMPLPAGSVRFVGDEGVLLGGHDGVQAAEELSPHRTELGCTWALERPHLIVSALWLERRSGKGEDAQPSFAFDPSSGTGLLATYDGTGGSGAAPAQLDAAGADLSGAYVAGRLARRGAESWFAGVLNEQQSGPAPEVQLHDELAARFAHEATLGVPTSGKFVGSLRRDLPTTIASTVFHVGANKLSLASMWAGDSRCHVLTPTAGLQQLTIDDTRIHDALEAIVTDAPMMNLVSADRPFTVHRRNFEFASPAVLVSSTDGCFGYVATPAHFEYLLLEGLQTAHSPAEWAANVLSQLENFTGDDASLVVVAIGWPDFVSLKQSFATRTAVLQNLHWTPFAGLNPADHERLSTLRMASWRAYKQHYEEYLPRPHERADPDPDVQPAPESEPLATAASDVADGAQLVASVSEGFDPESGHRPLGDGGSVGR